MPGIADPSVESPPVLLVGLTGGIGSGKSTVARVLAERGAVVVDADAVAREVVQPGRPAYDAVVERFGEAILDAGGRIDRPELAKVVFADDRARRDLEAITHPAVGVEMARRINEAPPDAIVVLDVPLLVEAAGRSYDVVVVVEAPEAERLERLARRGVAREDATTRMRAQASDDQRRAAADVVIDNSGDLARLEAQVDRLWSELLLRPDREG